MSALKYSIIKNKTQYKKYCTALEDLIENCAKGKAADEVDLLTLLIEKWDDEHTYTKSIPIGGCFS